MTALAGGLLALLVAVVALVFVFVSGLAFWPGLLCVIGAAIVAFLLPGLAAGGADPVDVSRRS